MEKIPTLFMRNPANMKLVMHEVNPEAAWVLEGNGIPTRKKDGTNIRVTVRNGRYTYVEKRRNPTREEKAAGAEPGYVDASPDDPADKHIFAAVSATNFDNWPDGASSCEALGPKIQGGIESDTPCLYPFSFLPEQLFDFPRRVTFECIRDYLAAHEIEGIVWHDQVNNRFAKIKRRDFDLPWPVKHRR
jgi:hypothetical protein